MRKVTLTRDQLKSVPGYRTRLSVPRLKGMIDGLLTERGVKNRAWITREGEDTLIFEMVVDVLGVQKTLGFTFQPPIIYVRKQASRKGRRVYVEVPEAEVSWRIFHDLLKSTLAAAKLGIMPVHHVLMAYISKQLPDGTPGTFGDFMDLVIAEDKLDQLALEDRREAKAVEAKVVEREDAEP